MKPTEILILNLEEVRRRSLKIWRGIPPEQIHWKPDADAMTCIESVRHVLEVEHLFLCVLKSSTRPPIGEFWDSLWNVRPYEDVEAEIEFAKSYREELLDLIGSFTSEDLSAKKVDHSGKGNVHSVGDYILKLAYHESVHAGQMLGYLRAMNAPRSKFWD